MESIYILVDPVTNQCRYVGKAKRPLERLTRHIWESKQPGRKKKVYAWIKSLTNKGELPEMVVLEKTDDWAYWETFYIEYFKSIGCNLTNLCEGGKGSLGYTHTAQSERAMGNIPWNTGKQLSKLHRNNISKGNTGKKFSDASKKKIGESNAIAHQAKSKLTIDNVKSIKASELSRKELAKKYDVSYYVIVDIKLGRRWSNV